MKDVIISNLYPCFCDELAKFGYNIIPSKNISVFHKPEQNHADMQVLKIKNRVFTLDSCSKIAGRTYPENILLNCLLAGDSLYGLLDYIDDSVKRFCLENNIKLVNVRQGYTRCSALKISENAVITADKSIRNALAENGVDVLLTEPGHIELKGFDYGFIGGAGFCDRGRVFFFGNVKSHPDYEKIKQFCEDYNSKIEILCDYMPLTDIGGAVLI